ncbi:putative membrane protein EpsK [bacterium BMS3Bbin04]|nr:putative membrane protein EpsK [bacterium BMS3Bbin04]
MNQANEAVSPSGENPSDTDNNSGAGKRPGQMRLGGGGGGQMLKNLWTNFLAITVQMILGMFLTRYLIRTLGPAEYSVVPLSFQMMAFFTLITSAITASVGRYLTIEMSRGEMDKALRTFNSSFWGMMMVFTVLIPVAVVLAWMSPSFLNYAEGAVAESQRVLMASAISFFMITASTGLMVSAFARNRIDLQNYVRIGWHTVRIYTPLILIGWFGWGLDGVSVGIVAGAMTHLTLSVRLWRKLNPELKLKPKLFNKKRFFELTDLSIWLTLDKIGRVLQFNASIIVVNMILGAVSAGRYGAIMIFGRSLMMYNRSIRLVATPIVYRMYGRGELEQVKRFLISFVRFEGIMLALPLAGLIMLAKPLLVVWLGPEYADLSRVVIWMMVGLIATMPNIPVRIIFAATKKVKLPAALSLSVGVANILLAIYMIHPKWGLDMGLVAMPISSLMTTQLKNFLFTPLYAAHVIKAKWYTFFLPFIRITMSYAFVLGLTWGLRWLFQPDSWWDLIWIGLITAVVYVPVGLLVFMTKEDRNHVKQVRRGRRRKQNGDQDQTLDMPENDIS